MSLYMNILIGTSSSFSLFCVSTDMDPEKTLSAISLFVCIFVLAPEGFCS